MTSSPHVDNRIDSVFDQEQNRRRRTLRTAIAMIAFISSGFAFMATSALNAADDDNDDSGVAVKWPYCIVTIDDLPSRPLKDAVAAFNKESKQSPIGLTQRPITEQETLDAMEKFVELPHVREDVKTIIREIMSSRTVPPNAYFRRFTRFDDEHEFHTVWWVHLVIQGEAPPVSSVPVRQTSIGSRPYTQMERQQNAESGVTLINRFSSYFQTRPTFDKPQVIPHDMSDHMVARVKKAIQDKSLDDLKQLFDWRKTSDSTRTFVESELEQLLAFKVSSVDIQPRTFDGTLVHWSAYQNYEPNRPVIGYLKVAYIPMNAKSRRPRTLLWELGQDKEDLRLVNYITHGERKLPKAAVAGLSMRGHLEPLADGTYFLTTTIMNPGTLISAHLANEEIWQRDLNRKQENADND